VYARLTYERKPGAGSCPGDDLLRIELARRLGNDPFEPNPERIAVGDVHVIVERAGDRFVARSDWTNAPDYEAPRRFAMYDCRNAVVALAVGLRSSFMLYSMKYGEMYAPKPKPPVCPAPAAAEPTPPACPEYKFAVWPSELPMAPLEAPKPSLSKPPERWPSALRFAVGGWSELIATGWGSAGISAEAGARFRAVSLDFEVHGDPPLGTLLFPNVGPVTFARVSGVLAGCGHVGWFAACALADAGRFIFPNHVQALPASAFYGAAGARAKIEAPIAPPRLFLSASVDLRAPIRPASYATPHGAIFAVAGPGAGLGLALLLELPP
jgi:hypothetical protein